MPFCAMPELSEDWYSSITFYFFNLLFLMALYFTIAFVFNMCAI